MAYRKNRQVGSANSAVPILLFAAAAGGVIGVAPILLSKHDLRARPPQPRDFWGGCNDARAAGTAPIYRGEPGYRSDMDGDGDGIACEPIR